MARTIEEPAHVTAVEDGKFALREYLPCVVAETEVTGEWDAASSQGFRRIAGYIFGGNTRADRIAMTAPVGQRKAGEKIAMTAPVGVRPTGDAWVISFTMPSASSLATLPEPNDARVVLRQQPGRRVAVHTFTGFWTDASMARHTEELNAWTAKRGLRAAGPPEINRYDPPWTLPWLRRNEIWVEVEAADGVHPAE